MTDTPRTDAYEDEYHENGTHVNEVFDFARTLERELAAMELRAMDCVALNERQAVNFAKCQAELAEARKDAHEWKVAFHEAKYSLATEGLGDEDVALAELDAARREKP